MRILLRPPPQLSRKSSNWLVQIKTRRTVLSSCVAATWACLMLWLVLLNGVWVCWFLQGDICWVLIDIFCCSLAGARLHHQQQHHHRPYVIEAPRIISVCADVGTARSRNHYKFLILITSASSYIVIGEVGGTWRSPAEHIAQPAAGPWSASLLCELLTWGPSSR
jgi:hypothetical protein